MIKDKTLTAAIFTLAFSILLSTLWIKKSILQLSTSQNNTLRTASHTISQELNEFSQKLNSSPSTASQPELTSLLPNPDSMYLKKAASYLGISKDELLQIINDSNSALPYLKTKSGTYIFNKKALDKWLEKSYLMP